MNKVCRKVLGLAAVLLIAGCANPVLPSGSSGSAARFPALDRATLSPQQLRVLEEARSQFDAQRPGRDYSEGVEEPWCADFVSWVFNAAGQPFSNPNSGYWRIPGVYTMQEYFSSAGRFEPPDFAPRPGDVVLWGESSPMGLHANIVVAAERDAAGTTLTTVGGNEEGGIRIRTGTVGPDTGLLGYGRLSNS